MLQSVAIPKDVPRYRMRRTGCYPRRSTCWGLGIAGTAELNALERKSRTYSGQNQFREESSIGYIDIEEKPKLMDPE
jgi:hypothetical protein